jgi:signal transduction histidine kinase
MQVNRILLLLVLYVCSWALLASSSKSEWTMYTLTETENVPGSERAQGEHSLRYMLTSIQEAIRFSFDSMDESNVTSAKRASVDFVIFKPIWHRWWFLIFSVTSAALLIHSIYRIRINQQLEMERLRTRIASDLHDDIGSSLSRIAVLSDAVRRKVNGDADVLPLLSNIAEASREAIDAMGDIVWVVNPKKDQLQDLESRMRHLACEMMAGRSLKFERYPSGQRESYTLSPDFKRNVFLIFKECLHNVVSHSDASKVEVRLDLENGFVMLEVRDNGKGFNPSQSFDGLGQKNMKKRAAELNGNLVISSPTGGGVVIRLLAPLSQSRFFRDKFFLKPA